MRELPILFSTPMVQAIQEHRKVMTRRTAGLQLINFDPNLWRFDGLWANNNPAFEKLTDTGNKTETYKFVKPRYNVGDKLWVKETFTIIPPNYIVYKAETENPEKCKWKSSLFMRKEYARLWLEVTEVRCERLHDITEADAIAEGITVIEKDEAYFDYEFNGKVGSYATAKGSFYSLWIKINGKDSWLENPWVFVYKFKRIEKP